MKPGLKTTRPRTAEISWEDYGAFVEKPLGHFMKIQDELLMRQITYLHPSGLWKKIVGNICPRSPKEFRDVVPLTTYEDYRETFAGKREDLLPAKVKVWAHTTGSTGDVKWVPYTEELYDRRGYFYITAAFLASGARGRTPFQPGDVFFYTVAPPPYATGLGVKSAVEKFDLVVLPPLEEAEKMSFSERVVTGFRMALERGRIDIIGGVASVLVSIGRMFEAGIGDYLGSDHSASKVNRRILEKYLTARKEERSLLPRDFFAPKIIACVGADVSLFADAVERYWGRRPTEFYGSTEAGLFAVQPFGCRDMVFLPDVSYLEFIPEEKYNDSRPSTCLISELEAGSRYEAVVTNFHGGCMFRYRTADLIEVVALKDAGNGINIPLVRFFSRADRVINLSGTVRLNERACWRIIESSGVNYKEWSVNKEFREERTFLHFYLETFEPGGRVLRKMRKAAAEVMPTFKELPGLLGYNPLEVTTLAEGTFAQYRAEKEAEGAELGHLKPMHVNPSPGQLERIKEISSALKEG